MDRCEQFTREGLESLAQGLEYIETLKEFRLRALGCDRKIRKRDFMSRLQRRLPKAKVICVN